MLIHFWYTSL